MAEIDYKALAQKMREQNVPPASGMPVGKYYAAHAIYAVIRGLEAMEEDNNG